MVFDDFKNTRPFTFPGLGFGVFGIDLRQAKGIAHIALHFVRKVEIVFFRGAYPMQRFGTQYV
jgi:hypothetical protein